jgi:hypothetical protein
MTKEQPKETPNQRIERIRDDVPVKSRPATIKGISID